jgi:hypothetical protein
MSHREFENGYYFVLHQHEIHANGHLVRGHLLFSLSFVHSVEYLGINFCKYVRVFIRIILSRRFQQTSNCNFADGTVDPAPIARNAQAFFNN